MDPASPAFRYMLLLFNCLLTFGSYYCFDMPTVLESKIEAQVVAGFTTEVSTYYNLFYTIYAHDCSIAPVVADFHSLFYCFVFTFPKESRGYPSWVRALIDDAKSSILWRRVNNSRTLFYPTPTFLQTEANLLRLNTGLSCA